MYVDTSALGKLLRPEPESGALRAYLEAAPGPVDSCELAATELRRMALRLGLPAGRAELVLARLHILRLRPEVYERAGRLPNPPRAGAFLRSLDALHIAAAEQIELGTFVTYDTNQGEVACMVGFDVVSPA